MNDREWRLWSRACDIRDEHGHGFCRPIFQHLALRGHLISMVELADWSSGRNGTELGAAADPFSAAGLYRRAFRRGFATAANNLAMSYFNRGDLQGYRYWIRRAGRAGDAGAAQQARRFETRLPHLAAKRVGRGRPEAARDADFV